MRIPFDNFAVHCEYPFRGGERTPRTSKGINAMPKRRWPTKAKAWTYGPKGCQTSHGMPIVTAGNGHLVAMMATRNPSTGKLVAGAPRLLAAAKAAVDLLPAGPARLELEIAIAIAKGAWSDPA